MMRTVKLAISLLATLALVAALVFSLTERRGVAPAPGTVAPTPRGVGFAATSIQKSIGDTVQEADLIVRSHVVSIGDPLWNSADGHHWREAYESDPTAYITSPMAYYPVALALDEVLTEGLGAPPVAVGDQLKVAFLDPNLGVGDERIFMLKWTEMYGSMPAPVQLWLGDAAQATWIISGSLARPADDMQAYSLASAILAKKIKGSLDTGAFRGAATLDAIHALVMAELKTPSDAVAILAPARFCGFTADSWVLFYSGSLATKRVDEIKDTYLTPTPTPTSRSPA